MSPTSRYFSKYAMRPHDPSVFGEFPDCEILGQRSILNFERMEDGDLRGEDIFGHILLRGWFVTHISGRNKYGEMVPGQWVRELAWQTARQPDGQSCTWAPSQPHAVVIATDSPTTPLHMSDWSTADAYLCLDSLLWEFNEVSFTPHDVLERVDSKTHSGMGLANSKLHLSAMRRYLERCVLLQQETTWKDALGGRVYRFVKVKRWQYRFQAEHAWKHPTQPCLDATDMKEKTANA